MPMNEAQKIVAGLVAAGLTQGDIADECGVSQPTVYGWKRGSIPLSDRMETLRAVARKYSVQIDRGFALVPPVDGSSAIKEIDTKLGAGGGGVPSLYNEEAYREAVWNMPDDFLRAELKISPKRAIIAEIVGDSGYDPANPHAPGSLHPGDRVIVDRDDRQPSPPGPFAVFDGLGFVIKHVDVIRDTDPLMLRLSSRNPAYGPYEVSESEGFFIVGRVKGRISRL